MFDEAHGILELDLITHRHSGIPLENCGCVAEYDEWDDQLTLWSSTQIPHLVRTGLADALEMPENRIRVIAPDVGGGFGIKGHLFPEEIAACVLAKLTGRPVKWIEDRREHLLASIHAREHDHRLQVAYTADGTVTALRARIYVDCGAYSVYPWTSTMDTGMALGILPGPYRIRHYECEAYSVTTNKCPLGPYRGRVTAAGVLLDRAGDGRRRHRARPRPARRAAPERDPGRRVPVRVDHRPRCTTAAAPRRASRSCSRWPTWPASASGRRRPAPRAGCSGSASPSTRSRPRTRRPSS